MDDFEWSHETYTIRQLALKDDNFPMVVRVNEGYLPEDGNEAEAFSQGDLIKLDYKKSYQKVAARFLDAESHVDDEGYLHPGGNLLIPLGYRGKLKILHQDRQYYSVAELVKEFPRFVRVQRSTVARSGQSQNTVSVPKGSLLELDRNLPSEGLVCRLNGKLIILNSNQKGHFLTVPDDEQYTLTEVIERFELPQNVQFLDIDFQAVCNEDLDDAIENIKKFKGCLKLMCMVRQEVVVGHYKPQMDTDETRSGHICRRAVALLPLDSPVVNEIEVQIPIYSEMEDYEFLVAKNFSEKLNTEAIEGALYVEFSNNTRIQRFEQSYAEDELRPPPRPPRPTRASGGKFV